MTIWPFSRRHVECQRTIVELNSKLTKLRASYDTLWQDHLSRCDCHDAWDQCPCSENGTHPSDCGCCQWCG